MKKMFFVTIILVLTLVTVLTGCGGTSNVSGNKDTGAQTNTVDNAKTNDQTSKDDDAKTANTNSPGDAAKTDTVNTELSGEITLWHHLGESDKSFENVIAGFNKKYPNVKVKNLRNGATYEIADKLKTAIAAGSGAPDVVLLEQSYFSKFNTTDAFVDLLQPPFDAKRYEGNFPENVWKKFHTLDGKKLMAIPVDAPPGVMYYRADIFEENGFPSDPDELATYMENPDNFMNMAQTLKAQGKYILEYDTEILDMLSDSRFFDNQLNYNRTGDKYIQGLDLSKKVKQLGLAANFNGDAWNQAMNNGKLAMTWSASWYVNYIKDDSKDNSGRWRACRQPLNTYSVGGGSALAIPSQSKNKEAAWAFVEYTLLTLEGQKELIRYNSLPAFKPALKLPEIADSTDAFLGGQKANELFASLVDKIPPDYPSALDGTASKIWNKGIEKAMKTNQDSRAALQQIADDVDKAVAKEKADLLKSIGQ
ncbi:ABC transporter substrate-binding protein [Paenibacillus azoreducens]|uniref:ABC transporter substrate-binding protein n=1 Tax=Paenibacillus azoreducens TaxID=116718 RepID=A0A919YC51_9BACL|nr:extracellular solute-binding protein [Paenibacillus azoreducens]GIO47003.1 ABC transporter substrate-binding protein [Paenibacillus azoreducens]